MLLRNPARAPAKVNINGTAWRTSVINWSRRYAKHAAFSINIGNMSAMHGARQFVCLVAHCCMLDNFSSQHSYHKLNARDRGG